MAQFLNEKDFIAKVLIPTTTSSTTNPSTGDTIGGASYTVPSGSKAHVLAITVSGSAAGKMALSINGSNVYTIRVAANGFIRVVFYERTFTADETQVIKIVAADDLTGDYEAHMEIWIEDKMSY